MSGRPRALVISNIAWSFVWQRHQTIATFLARDFEVTFCELPGVRRVRLGDAARIWKRALETRQQSGEVNADAAGIRIMRPRILPSTNRLFCAWNGWRLAAWLQREKAMAQPWALAVNYSPARAAIQLLDLVRPEHLIYDCTDDFLAVRGIPEHLAQDERAILRRADLTLVPSRALLDRKGPFAKRIERLPHGALVERFLPSPGSLPPEGPPVLLYYGHLHRQHLDFRLIEGVARLRPEWRIVLVGPAKSPVAFPPNVMVQGQVAHENLREHIARAHCLLLPYVLNRYTEAVLPAKSYECLATGLPIVAVPLPELVAEFSGLMRFGGTAETFVHEIEAAMLEPATERERRIEVARSNGWERRYATLRERLIEIGALRDEES